MKDVIDNGNLGKKQGTAGRLVRDLLSVRAEVLSF